jgi:predicted transcriptional regulator
MSRARKAAKTRQVGVRLEPEVLRKLERIAKLEDRTVSHVARIAIREFIERKTSRCSTRREKIDA